MAKKLSPYAFWFDPGTWHDNVGWKNYCWSINKNLNITIIGSVQEEYTKQLKTRGWVRLSEIMEALGVCPNEVSGSNIGWVWKEGRENRIDLGVFEGPNQCQYNRGFADRNNVQNTCIINPNVDGDIGYIFEDIEKYDKRFQVMAKNKWISYFSYCGEVNADRKIKTEEIKHD